MEIYGKYNKAIVYQSPIDSESYSQIQNLVNQKFVEGEKIRVMPDCHAGASCTIGYTQTITNGKIVPNLVGVDIACGVIVTELGDMDINYEELDKFIHENIPAGQEVNETPQWKFKELEDLRCWHAIKDREAHFRNSIGTLGGGNHFIEIDVEPKTGNKYLLVHTGSRNLGKKVAEYYQRKAIEYHHKHDWKEISEKIIAKAKAEGRQAEIGDMLAEAKKNVVSIPDEFAYLEGQDMKDYLHDVAICTKYAKVNRRVISGKIVDFLRKDDPFKDSEICGGFETLHNYIDIENGIIRKGSVSAQKGEKLVIPINMKDGSLICKGKGNPDYNYSAPHGAGRLFSRSMAKELIDLKDFEESMKGIYTTCVNESTIDESCFAYRSVDEILPFIEPTCDVIERIYPKYNFKAAD